MIILAQNTKEIYRTDSKKEILDRAPRTIGTFETHQKPKSNHADQDGKVSD